MILMQVVRMALIGDFGFSGDRNPGRSRRYVLLRTLQQR
jgi:hypothetical protein